MLVWVWQLKKIASTLQDAKQCPCYLTYFTMMKKKMKFHFPFQNVFRWDEKREQAAMEEDKSLHKAESRSRAKTSFNQSYIKRINMDMLVIS